MSDTDEKMGPLTANPEDVNTLFYSYHEVGDPEYPGEIVTNSYRTLINLPGQANQKQKICGESKLNPCGNFEKEEAEPTDEKVGPLTANSEYENTLFYPFQVEEQPVLLDTNSSGTLTNSPVQANQKQQPRDESKLNPYISIDKDEANPRFGNEDSKRKSGALEKLGYISKISSSVETSPIRGPIEYINNGFSSSDDNSSISSTSPTISSICDEINSGAGIEDKDSAGINSMAPPLPVDVSIAKNLPTPQTAMIRRSSQVCVSSTKESQCDQNNSGFGIYKESTANAPCHPLEPNIIIVTGKATSTEKTALAQRLDESYQSEDKIAKDWPSLETPTIIQHSPPAGMESMAKPGETDGVKSKQHDVENVRPVAQRDLINKLINYIRTKRQSSKRWRYAGNICLELLIFGLLAAILISVMHSGYKYILFVLYSLLELRIVYILCHSCNSKTDTEKKVKSGRVRSKVETFINTLLVALLSGDLLMIQLSYYLVPIISYGIVYSLLVIRQVWFTSFRLRNACTCHLSHTHRMKGLAISSLTTIIFGPSFITSFELGYSGTILMTPMDFQIFLLFIFIALFPLFAHINSAQHLYSVHQSCRGTKLLFGLNRFLVVWCVSYVLGRYTYTYITWQICSSYHRSFNHGFQLGNSLHKTIFNSSQVVTFYELDGLNNTYSTEYRCLLDLAEQAACPPYTLRLFESTFEDFNSC